MLNRLLTPIALFLAGSLLIHIVVWVTLLFVKGEPDQRPNEAVEITLLEPPTDEQLAEMEKMRQIVEQDQQLNDEIDATATRLSQFNQKVLKETKAQQSGAFTNTALSGSPTAGTPDAPKNNQPQKQAQTLKSDQRGELPSLKELSPQFSLSPKARPNPTEEAGRPSQTDDYLKDVEVGMQTLLSTREFVYYSYYARIKEKIRQHWEPTVRAKVNVIYKQGRTIASASDRITQVVVVLDANGTLLQVEIIGQSGVHDLDQAAVEAFQAAAPFPNPPKGIVEGDGKIRIRWDFILEA